MNFTIFYTIISLSSLGILAGVILYFVAKNLKLLKTPVLTRSTKRCLLLTAVAVDIQGVEVLQKLVLRLQIWTICFVLWVAIKA